MSVKNQEVTLIEDDAISLKATKRCSATCVMSSPNTVVPMICCRLCDGWFHYRCVGLPDQVHSGSEISLTGSYVCVDCSKTLENGSPRRIRKRRHLEALDNFLADVASNYVRLREMLTTDEVPAETDSPSRFVTVETLDNAGTNRDLERSLAGARSFRHNQGNRRISESGASHHHSSTAVACGSDRQCGDAAVCLTGVHAHTGRRHQADLFCTNQGWQTEPHRAHSGDCHDQNEVPDERNHQQPDCRWSDPRPAVKRRRLLAWRDNCNESLGHHDDVDREVSFHRRHRHHVSSPTDLTRSATQRRSRDCYRRHRDDSTDGDSDIDDGDCGPPFQPLNHQFHGKRISEYCRQCPTSCLPTVSVESENGLANSSVLTTYRGKKETKLEEAVVVLSSESSIGSTENHPNGRSDSNEKIEEDLYLYCYQCRLSHLGNCPLHGLMTRIHDSIVSKDDPKKAESSLPPGFLIRESSLPGAGLGVFSLQEVDEGVVIGPYGGKVTYESHDSCDSDYCWHIVQNFHPSYCVDGKDMASSNWLRFINCANEYDQQNLTAFQYMGQIFYRTIKKIKKGSELLVWYGREFAKVLGLDSETPSFKRRCKRTNIGQRSTLPVVSQNISDGYVLQFASNQSKQPAYCQSHVVRKRRGNGSSQKVVSRHVFSLRCQQCKRSFSNTHGLRRHTTEVHEGRRRKRPSKSDTTIPRKFHCSSCQSKFYTKAALVGHHKRKHC